MDYPRQRQRHSRAMVRHHRERVKGRRCRQFARWCGEVDRGAGLIRRPEKHLVVNAAPRPQEIWEAEFWSGRRTGLLAKWNGTRSKRRGRAVNAYRLPSKAEQQERARLQEAA